MNVKQKHSKSLAGLLTLPTVAIAALAILSAIASFVPLVNAAQCGGVEVSVVSCDSSVAGGALFAVIATAIKIMTAGIGILAVGGLVYGAIVYASAAGSQEQTRKAMTIIRNTVSGLLIYTFLFAIVNFLLPGGVLRENSPVASTTNSNGQATTTNPKSPGASTQVTPPVATTPAPAPSTPKPTTETPPPQTPNVSAKPSSANTGVPTGHKLVVPVTDAAKGITVAANGNVKITKPGIFENLLIKGRLEIRADNVTIRYSRIEANPVPWDLKPEPTTVAECTAYGGTAPPAVSIYNNKNLLIEDSEIEAVRKSTYISNGIHGSGYTLRRVDISGTVDGAGIYNTGAANTLIENSYIHDLYNGQFSYGHGCTPSHADGIQIHYGSNMTIRNNTIKANSTTPYKTNAAIMVNQNGSYNTSGVTIQSNWIDYGTCSINVHDSNKATTIKSLAIIGNKFGKNQTTNPKCTMIVQKVVRNDSSNNISGNVWEDGSTPVPTVTNGG